MQICTCIPKQFCHHYAVTLAIARRAPSTLGLSLHIILWLSNGVLNIFSRFLAFFPAFSALTFILWSKIFAAVPFLVDNGVTELQKKIGAFVRRVNKKSLIYPLVYQSPRVMFSSTL